ncbi:phage tail protein [Citrobacter telavivensis]
MTAKYLAILTNQGAAKLANAAALGTKLNLTQLAVGDGNGVLPTPDPAQTKLVNQKRIAPLNQLSVDPNNASQIIAEQIIPENEGGFWIREIGLYDDDGDLIAVANCPETYKPQLQEGSGRTQTIRMILIVSSTSAVTLKIDPSVVLATRKYADDKVLELKLYTDEKLAKALALKQPLDQTLSNLSGKTVGGILEYLRLGAGTPAIGIPFFWPLAAMPNTVMDEWSDMVFLKPNGASFSAATYPKLAKVWTGLVIPDMRGEFPRIWDDGRGVDAGRALLSFQGDASRNITGSFGGTTNNDTCSVLGNGSGVFANGTNLVPPTNGSAIGATTRPVNMTLDISRQVPTAEEFRSRNIALNFLVRAK